jgi:hypothetical protein
MAEICCVQEEDSEDRSRWLIDSSRFSAFQDRLVSPRQSSRKTTAPKSLRFRGIKAALVVESVSLCIWIQVAWTLPCIQRYQLAKMYIQNVARMSVFAIQLAESVSSKASSLSSSAELGVES